MNSKTKHRILGILVLIGLVILVWPLFQIETDTLSETAVTKAPPFPDQYVQLTSPSTPSPQLLQSGKNESGEQVAADFIHQQSIDTINDSQAPDLKQMKLSEAFKVNQSSKKTVAVNAKQPLPHLEKHPIKESSVKHKPLAKNMNNANNANNVNKAQDEIKQRQALAKIQAEIFDELNKDGLIVLKKAVWVIQIGSFKDKEHALRMVNQLRTKGYKAFIQQVPTTFGSTTRVFVGPEIKQASAHAIANRLENELHIRGFVISYKPLAL